MRHRGTRVVAGLLLAAGAGAVMPSAGAQAVEIRAGGPRTTVAADVCTYQVRGVYDWLNVRSGPGTNYRVIGRLQPNQYVTGNCRQAGGPGASVWVNVRLASGTWGWASKDYLALMP